MVDQPAILLEDDWIIAVDKPGGMPSASLKAGEVNTVASWLLERHPELAALPKGDIEAGLVNRLDNETSGIVLAARTPDSYEDLRRQFSSGEVGKEYLALVIGSPPDDGEVNAPIAHHPRKKRRMVVCESEAKTKEWKGRSASTSYRTIERYRDESGDRTQDYALLSVRISTGVRHQIRVHLAHAGFPIAGDDLYRNPKRRAEDNLELGRQFLHATKLTIGHPKSGDTITIESPLPEDLQEALNQLKHV